MPLISLATSGCASAELAALDRREHADGADQVLVHRVVVVHVELHHRHHPAEVRDEAAEHARLVHAPERRLRILAGGEHLQEDAVGLRVVAQSVVDEPQRPAQQAQRVRMEEKVVVLGRGEVADQVDRIAPEDVVAADVEAAIVEPEVTGGAGLPEPAKRVEHAAERRLRLHLLHLERRAKESGEIAHVLGHQEVMLHEALDGPQAGSVDIAHTLRHRPLDVEGEALLGPPGEKVQVAPHAPEEALAAPESGLLSRREGLGFAAAVAQTLSVEVLRQPVQRVQVAQAALAVLDIGLHPVPQLAGAPVALVALGELGLDEPGRSAGHHLGAEAAHHVLKQRPVAQHEPRIEDGGADRHVAAGEPERLIDIAGGVAHLEAQVPQQIEHVLHHALAPRGLPVRQQEQEVHIGERREQPAPVAARGHDRHVLGRRGVLGAVGLGDGIVVHEADEGILEGGEPRRTAPPAAVGEKVPLRLRPRRLEQRLEAGEHVGPRLVHAAVGFHELCQLGACLDGVEIGGLGVGGDVHGAREGGTEGRSSTGGETSFKGAGMRRSGWLDCPNGPML